MKLQAGALFYALAVSVIIGMITACAIAAAYYHRLLLHVDAVQLEVARNAESGVAYACAMESREETVLDLFGRQKDSLRITREAWGVYDVITSHAWTGSQTYTRYALVGAPLSGEAHALWLADMDRPLQVTGNTLLKGKCFLPRQGVERAYLEGRSFSGRELVSGAVAQSERFLPAVDRARREHLLSIQETTDRDSVVSWEEFTEENYSRSFADARLYLRSANEITIGEMTLCGHVLISSAKKIIVSAYAQLGQIILCAPEIEFREKASVSVQAVACDSIYVAEKAELLYPSALVVIGRQNRDSCGIVIAKNARVSGEVIFLPYVNDVHGRNQLLIAKDAVIAGNVYSQAPVDLKGRVYGSLTCQKFVLHTSSAVYENTLMDAVIDRTAISPAYLGSFLLTTTPHADVIQWLH